MTSHQNPVLGNSAAGHAVPLDLDRLIASRMLLTANSGGGKSLALRRLLEQTHGRVQHLVIDVEGEFHTLRERFDYVLAARTGGDTLADVRTAPLLARRLLELGVSAVLDIYELKSHDRIRFARLFLEALVDAPRELWHPALVVVDEAHLFCPQHGEAESAAAVIDLMTRGRKRGFCGVLATQRLSKLHKDAAAEANVALIGRAALDVDTKRAADVLGFSGRDEQARLRQLQPGHFFAFGPGLSDAVVELQVGPVVTTHPKPGQRSAVPAPREKVKAVLSKLADLPKEAEAEAKTAAELRAQVASLQRELRAVAKPAPVKAVADPAALHELRERVTAAARTAHSRDRQTRRALAALTRARDALTGAATEIEAGLASSELPEAPPAPAASHAPRRAIQPPATNGDGGDLPRGERAMLTAAAQYDGADRQQLTALTGYKRSTRDAYIQRLRERGYLDVQGDTVTATDEGVAALGPDFEPLPEGDALLQHWLGRLPEGERRVLEVVVETYPEPADRDSITERTGYKRSTRDAYLQRLGTRRLVTATREGVVANEALFDGGRR